MEGLIHLRARAAELVGGGGPMAFLAVDCAILGIMVGACLRLGSVVMEDIRRVSEDIREILVHFKAISTALIKICLGLLVITGLVYQIYVVWDRIRPHAPDTTSTAAWIRQVRPPDFSKTITDPVVAIVEHDWWNGLLRGGSSWMWGDPGQGK